MADDQARTELTTDLDQLFREGARRMLAAALEAEVDAYLAAHAELVDERGHRLVVRNGHAPARTITTGVGQVEVVWPRVDDRRTDPARPAAAVPQRAAAPLAPALLQGGRGATAAVPAWTVQLKRTVAFWSRRHRRREPLPLRRCPEGRRVPRSRRLPGSRGVDLGGLRPGSRRQQGPSPADHHQAALLAKIA